MNDDEQQKPNAEEHAEATPQRSWMRWILPTVALAAAVVLGAVLKTRMHNDVWAYYTDDEGLKVDAQAKKERMVLWEDPRQSLFEEEKPDPENPKVVDPVNQASKRVEAAFSADGTKMILTRWSKDFEKTKAVETGADLYLSIWNGRIWSRPSPIADLNTDGNERGAAFSRDGKYLYFSSDRDGGAGGYDIYVARFNGRTWTAVERLGDAINSSKDETGPASSTDDSKLFFSSNRKAENKAQDIFVARRVEAKPKAEDENATKSEEAESELPAVPTFAQAESVSILNSSADDIEAALTGRGDHVFLASDRDRNNQSGFNLYLSRVVNGKMRPPQKIDVYIKKGNATDPAVRMEGFNLLFSADGDLTGNEKVAETAPKYRLYQTTTREVIGYTDLSEWELFKALMNKIIWWILLAIAALIALIYLLEKWRDITNLYHKCLAASAMVHMLLLLLLSYWLISQVLDGGDRQAPEIAVSVDNLAEEELAMESQQELAQMSRSTQLIVDKNVQEFREVQFNAAEAATDPIPAPRRTTDQSLVSDFNPSKLNESEATATEAIPTLKNDASVLQELSPTELPGLEVSELEIGEVANAQPVDPVDPTKDDFKLNEESLQKVKTDKAKVDPTKSRKVDVVSEAQSVAASSKPAPATDTVDPVDGLEANTTPQPLKSQMTKETLASNLPGDNPVDSLAAGLELEVGEADPTEGDFKRKDGNIQQVKTTKGQTGRADNKKVDVQSNSKSVTANSTPAPTTDTGGDTVNPVDGLEANVVSPKLEGVITQPMLAMNLPGKDAIDELSDGIKLELPKDSPNVENLGMYVKKLRGKPSLEIIEQLGGSDATERAIGLGLEWFTTNQEPDGHWEMSKHSSNNKYNTAGAGLALLCYYGWGIKHADNTRHARAQSKALAWMLKQQKANGDLRGAQGGGMYCHGIAAIALCEAYGLTKDPKLKEPATRAIDFILKAQHAEGGWRYAPGQGGDLSVTGWQYMAMHSARMADLKVPDEAFVNARKFIGSVSGGKIGGRYGYTGKGNGPPAMTATGMFMRQLDLSPPTAANQQESATYLKAHMLKANRVDFYYDYYATLALYQHQGPVWKEWNENMKKIYVALQHANGANKGSWDPKGNHVNTGGRVLATGLAILSLEVYYRLLPMYGFGRD
jgi:hypothetical protein